MTINNAAALTQVRHLISIEYKTVAKLVMESGLPIKNVELSIRTLDRLGQLDKRPAMKEARKTRPFYEYRIKTYREEDRVTTILKEGATTGPDLPFYELHYQTFHPEKVANLDLYDHKLSVWFEALIKKEARARTVGNDLTDIIAYCLENKILRSPEYNIEEALTELEEIEYYLLGLAIFCNQLRNDPNCWDRTQPVDKYFHTQSGMFMSVIHEHYLRYINRINQG